MSLSFKSDLNMYGTISEASGIGSRTDQITVQPRLSFADGSGANQASKMLQGRFTIPVATTGPSVDGTKVIDLTTDLNSFGAALGMTKIKLLYIYNRSTTLQMVFSGGTNGVVTILGDATETQKIPAGGEVYLTAPTAAGFAVTASTADNLTFSNASTTTTLEFDVLVVGS